jgi:hypothetical protein
MFVFIVDTSMTSSNHLSALDITKHAIESFLVSAIRLDSNLHLMLLETGQNDDCLLSSFGDPTSLFEQKLRNINCRENKESNKGKEATTVDFSYPISYALSILNTYRMKSGVDTFGHGRAPWLSEPVDIILFTDGNAQALKSEISLTGKQQCNVFLNSALRWDHKISCVLVKTPG